MNQPWIYKWYWFLFTVFSQEDGWVPSVCITRWASSFLVFIEYQGPGSEEFWIGLGTVVMHGEFLITSIFKKSPATVPTTYVAPYCKMHGPHKPVLWHLLQLLGPCCCPHPQAPIPYTLWGWLSWALLGAVLQVQGEVMLLHPSSIRTGTMERESPEPCSPAGLAPWLWLGTSISFLLLPASLPMGLLPGRQHVPQSCLSCAPRRCTLTS